MYVRFSFVLLFHILLHLQLISNVLLVSVATETSISSKNGKNFKKTDFMSATELALRGNLSAGDIIENKIMFRLPNGPNLELPLFHKAIVVDPLSLQIVHYRFKNENDTTLEERQKIKSVSGNAKAEAKDIAKGLLDSVVGQVKRDFKNANGLSGIRSVRIDCRGPIRNGLMDLIYKYDARNRKVYQDNLVQSIGEPCRVNNELDARWPPLPVEEIVRRAQSRIGEERFEIKNHNCETFANWARYGVNYTEQGERIGVVLNNGIQGFEALCERANRDLVNIVEWEIERVKDAAIKGGAKGSVFGTFASAVLCSFFPSACFPIYVTSVTTTTVGNAAWNFKVSLGKAVENVDYRMRKKMAEYQPELVRMLGNLVTGLKLDEIVKIDV